MLKAFFSLNSSQKAKKSYSLLTRAEFSPYRFSEHHQSFYSKESTIFLSFLVRIHLSAIRKHLNSACKKLFMLICWILHIKFSPWQTYNLNMKTIPSQILVLCMSLMTTFILNSGVIPSDFVNRCSLDLLPEAMLTEAYSIPSMASCSTNISKKKQFQIIFDNKSAYQIDLTIDYKAYNVDGVTDKLSYNTKTKALEGEKTLDLFKANNPDINLDGTIARVDLDLINESTIILAFTKTQNK
jgi:hypothetical protein